MKKIQKKIKLYLFIAISICLSENCAAQTQEELDEGYNVEMGMLNAINTNDYKTALIFSKKNLKIVKKRYGENSTDFYQALHDNALIIGQLEGIKKEIELTTEILDFSKKSKPNPFYCCTRIWRRLSTAYGEVGQYEKENMALDTAILYASKRSGEYERCLVDKSMNLLKQQKYAEAEQIILPVIKNLNNNSLNNKYDYSYLRALNVYLDVLFESNSYEKGLPYLIKAEKELNEKSVELLNPDLLNSLAISYAKNGDRNKGIVLLKKIINYNNPKSKVPADNKFNSLCNLSVLLKDNGYVDSSFYYLEQAKIVLEEITEPLDKKKATLSLNHKTGFLYAELGNYTEAINYFSKNLKIIGKDSLDQSLFEYYYIAVHNLTNMYALNGNNFIDAAIKEENKLVNLVENKKIQKKENISSIYNAMGDFYHRKRDFIKATYWFEKEVNIEKELFGKNSLQVQLYEGNLAKIQFLKKNYADALPIYIKSYEAGVKLYGSCHTRYNKQLYVIISSYKNLKQPEKALLYLEKAQNLVSCVYEKEMPNVDEKTRSERVKNLENYNGTIYEFAKTYPTYGSTYAYDLALLNKGIVLNYSQNWKKTLENTQDDTLKNDFEKWLMCKRFLSRQYQVELSKRSSDTDSIARFAEQLEGNLSRSSKVFQTATATVNWQDVQAKLQEGEAAIEFVDYKYSLETLEGDTVHQYLAILLRKNEQPKVISLYDEKTITKKIGEKILEGSRYTNIKDNLFDLWQPLEPHLQGIKKIYYSPSGLLNRVSFGAIAYDTDKYLCDKYEFRLLRSTRELVVGNDIKNDKNPKHLIIGNIDFGNTDLLAKNKSSDNCLSNFENGESEFLGFIENAKNANVKYIAKQKKEATEAFVKSVLVAPSPAVMIFSTHGYYEEKPRTNAKNPLQSIKEPLLRTGIMLSDANLAWCGNQTSNDKEDELLTAYEISNMDLSNTQVVVLSACQSGVGDLQGSEGVYGLQRAFKMAGVKNVLCTLWSVDATVAQSFVDIFYKEILAGKKAHEAFVIAQNNLRKTSTPNLWGAFVLVE